MISRSFGSSTTPLPAGRGNNTLARHRVDRHPGQAINVSFFGGHSKPVSKLAIHELQSSRLYDTGFGKTTGQMLSW